MAKPRTFSPAGLHREPILANARRPDISTHVHRPRSYPLLALDLLVRPTRRPLHPFVLLFAFFVPLLAVSAAPADDFAAAERADEQRIAATIAGDTATLADLLSEQLHYAHSDGRVQSKEEFLAAVGSSRIKYLSFVPHDVKYQSIAAGAVAMNGRARISAENGGRPVNLTLRFLAIWRKEAGTWRLLSYQSSQLQEVSSP